MAANDGDHFGAYQALPVAQGEPDWDSGQPQTAEEYLKRVRWEAAHCEQVKRAAIDAHQFEAKQTTYLPQAGRVDEAPGFCLPTTTWIVQTLTEFHKLHNRLEEEGTTVGDDLPMGVPLLVNRVDVENRARIIEEGLQNMEKSIPPDMAAIAALDQVEALELLQTQIQHFVKLKKMEEISDVRCFWLYALLCRVHRPLHDTTGAAVRSLFKHCTRLRAVYAKKWRSRSAAMQSELLQSGLLPRLNLLIAVTGVYFGQGEKMSGMIELEELLD